MNSALFTSSQANDIAADRYLTISVDDGSAKDPKTADLLHKYGLRATFYVPASNPERPVILPGEIREVAKRFEVGSHTMSHLPINRMSDEHASREVEDGKNWLEDVLGERVISFCYPRGKFNRATPRLVREAGFLGARTTMMNLCDFPENPFLWGVSTQAYSHSRMIQVRHALLERNFAGIRNFFYDFRGTVNWQQHFAYALNHVEKFGGIAHLILHSWEMEEMGVWSTLESVLESVSRRDLASVTNGDLFRLWSSEKLEQAALAEPVARPK
ncbi:MAG: polysaccharide deacetylase family protein [Terriglobales bacterium]